MRLNRLVAGPALPGCGKTQIPPGLGKGTSSTRAVTAAESIAASSRWANAALQKHFFSSLLVLALLLGGRAPLQYAFAQVQHNSGNQEPLIAAGQRKPAPNFILPDAKGDTINLSTYKGKVVLLDFWATW